VADDVTAVTYHTAHLTHDPARSVVWKVVAHHLAEHIPPDADVLEIGAGYCDWINHVRAARRVAVDVWPEVSRHAAPGVEAVLLDASGGLTPFGEATFDVVLASNLLEHFPPDTAAAVARDVWRVLRPGGRFIIIQPNFRYAWRSYFDDYTHRAVFTDVSIAAMLRAQGFRVDRAQPRFLPYSMQGSRVPITSWLVKAYLLSPIKPFAGQMLVVASRA
jgi:SAM-dependent methyltransferase